MITITMYQPSSLEFSGFPSTYVTDLKVMCGFVLRHVGKKDEQASLKTWKQNV